MVLWSASGRNASGMVSTADHVVLLSTAGELDVAVDRDDASDPTQSEAVISIRRLANCWVTESYFTGQQPQTRK